MNAMLLNEKKKQILKQYNYEVTNVESITPKMWSDLSKLYAKNINLSLEDLRDLNIVKIAFIEGTTFEIQSIGGTANRMMVLPLQDTVPNMLKPIIQKISVH